MALFSAALLRLRQDLDESRENRRKLIHRLRAEARQTAHQTGDWLAEQGSTRRAEFAAMMQDLRGTIRRQAGQTQTQLAELTADLRRGGEIFGGRPPATHGSRR